MRIRTVPHRALLEIPGLETGVSKAHWNFNAKHFALFYGMVDIRKQAKQRGSKVSDPFSLCFQDDSTDCCGAKGWLTTSLICSLQVVLITRTPGSETNFTDLNPFWSWRENYMLLNF